MIMGTTLMSGGVAIAGTIILVPCHAVKSLQYIWSLGYPQMVQTDLNMLKEQTLQE